ncbi:MAG TPA: ABC transporter substrate-binding protein [Acidimicrobiia bacterium]|nr:ABC transporter substrate-binding protein [Acidimicrobiia bacterium]
MRKISALVVALVSVLGVAGVAWATAPGVSKDEIKLGVTYVDFEPIKDIVDISHGDYVKTFNAVIDDLNKKGGVDGRKLVPVYEKVNPLGTAPAQEVCLKLTEDDKVFAVVGFFILDAPLCYVAQHDTPILGGTMNPTYLKQATAPWMTLDSGPEVTPRAIDALAAGGAFKGKVGVVAVAQEEKNLLDAVVVPSLKRNGVKYTDAIIDVPLTDTVAAQQQAGTIGEKFKSEGIKTLLLVGSTPTVVSNALKNTDYRPKLVGVPFSTFQGAALNKATDPALWKGSVTSDIAADFKDPSLQKCYGMVEKATGDTIVERPPPGTPDYQASARIACQYISLFSQLAGAAGKDLTVAGFGKAAQKLGSVTIPGLGTIKYDPKTHTWAQPLWTYKYDATTKQLVQDKKIG